jgi:hypothetical protein
VDKDRLQGSNQARWRLRAPILVADRLTLKNSQHSMVSVGFFNEACQLHL